MNLHDTNDDGASWVRLPWDSDHFGIPIGRLLPSSVTENNLLSSLRSAEKAGIRCLYWLSDPTGSQIEIAQRAGFKMVDMRVELKIQVGSEAGSPANPETIRTAEEVDVGPLKVLASTSHRNTRFYADGTFPVDRADALYAAWIEGSLNDPSQVVLVSGSRGRPDGYVAFGVSNNAAGAIGLVGVEESRRGRGIGSTLVAAALHRLADDGAREVTVVTSGANEAAQRLYTRLGFSVRHEFVWFHRWFGNYSQGSNQALDV